MRMRRIRFEVDREEGKLLGVCAGIARSTGVDATIIRVGAVLLAIFASFTWTAIVYGALAAYGHMQRRDRDGTARLGRREEPSPERIRSHELRMRAIETYASSSNSRLAREIEELR